MTRLTDLSITRKLALVILLTCMATLIVASVALGVYDRQVAFQTLQQHASQLASLLATNSSAALLFEDQDAASEMLMGLRSQPDVHAAAIYDADNRPFARYRTLVGESESIPGGDTSFFANDLYVIYRTIELDGERIGTVHAEVDLASTNLRTQRFTAVVIGLLLLLPTVTWFGSRRLQRFVAGPILELVEAAREVSATQDYSIRAEKRSNDEVGLLIENFNQMLGQIEDRDERLRGEGDRLEQEVSLRTQELRVTNERLEIATSEAVAASRAKSEFIANMSHEIRTPMNGILGMAEILLDSDLTASQQGFVRTVWESAEDLLAIINDILDFSKAEAGKLELESAPFSPGRCAERVADLMAGRAHLKGLELVNEIGADVPAEVVGDGKRLRQVLTNIVGNAIKFTERGEVVVRQRLVSKHDGMVTLHFEVVDSGIGIQSEKQQQIFDGFAQADSSTTREFGGTGLGLTISKHLVEMMDGSIGVTSRPGDGATFWFTVTVKLSEPKTSAAAGTETEFEGCRVLIVDDNASNRDVLEQQVSRLGGIGIAVGSGEQALAMVCDEERTQTAFDVALIDRNMPGMSGTDLVRAIRAIQARRGLPLVLLSSGSQGATTLKDVEVEASLAKPVRQAELRDCLARVTGRAVTAPESAPSAPGDDHRCVAAVGSRVLVAEDNEVNQEVARRLLESLGCQVDVVTNGVEAIDAVRHRRYDLVFMDCQMPKMDGYQAARQIRMLEDTGVIVLEGRDGPAGRLPVVALTAHSMPSDRARSLDNGMDDFLSKPFTRQSLRAVLERWLTWRTDGEPPPEPPTLDVNAASYAVDDQINDEVLEQIYDLDRRSGGNGFENLVRIYLKRAQATIGDLRAAVGESDAEGIARAAHSLKSASYQLGAERMGAVCAKLEALGRQGVTDAVPALAAELDRLFPAVAEALQARLDVSKADLADTVSM